MSRELARGRSPVVMRTSIFGRAKVIAWQSVRSIAARSDTLAEPTIIAKPIEGRQQEALGKQRADRP